MHKTAYIPVFVTDTLGAQGAYRCLACGTTENVGRKRYCSKECRLELLRRLEVLKSLLRALRTRYATFSFTESELVLDVLPCGSRKVYTFVYDRTHGLRPAQDLGELTDSLGSLWWENHRRTGKRYRASQLLLDQATKNDHESDSVIPLEINSPVKIGKSLRCLKLTNRDIRSSKAREMLKSAYWRAALHHHPDRGGASESFRKANNAYQEILKWLETPTLRRRRGLPGKWCFDGTRWITPLRRK